MATFALPLSNTSLPPTQLPSPPASILGSPRSGSFSEDSPLPQSLTSKIPPNTFPLAPPTTPPTTTLDIDKPTPDAHVPRDPRLIRLTGVHPFNVEAPLSDLYDSGFLTPQELFYVRNHGAVPEVKDHELLDWTVTVEGLVTNPLTLNLAALSSFATFPQYTLPITLVCAGNRRKEQNMVRKSKGFSWGPAGVSTSLFTGPLLADVLAAAQPLRGRAKYVWFEGADDLPNGKYGTSIRFSVAANSMGGCMLAYKMNGEMLRPDHGRPLRVVIPGMIGGRSVKWLKRIIVSDRPSDNWYHIYDNRVLPTMISPEESATEEAKKYWEDERFAIYDLNANSAVCYPAHDETMTVQKNEVGGYSVRGYAYGGGGRRITRVEVSLDKGVSWKLATLNYPEDAYRSPAVPTDTILYGGILDMHQRDTCFCWCFWDITVPFSDLLAPGTQDIVVRCMDEGLHLQPKEMYWSVLGMMNNPWFRVVVHKEVTQDGEVKVRFEHPTQPALMKGGWMERVKNAGGDLMDGKWGEEDSSAASSRTTKPAPPKKEEIVMTNPEVKRTIEFKEFRAHTEKDAGSWFVLEGEVYDGSSFFNDHPGGAQSIISAGGTDCTEEFLAIHSETAKAMMSKYHIGTLSAQAKEELANPSSAVSEVDVTERATFLDSRRWLSTNLTKKEQVSRDTVLLTFSLQHETQTLGLPTGQHIMVRLHPRNSTSPVIRAYTPISPASQPGTFTLLVKVYRNEGTPERGGGVMSQELDALEHGGAVEVKGPVGKYTVLDSLPASSAAHNIDYRNRQRSIKNFLMICGGTGITPVFQVLRALLTTSHVGDGAKCFIAYGNRTADDILAKAELEALLRASQTSCRVKLVHALSQTKEDEMGGVVGEGLGDLMRVQKGRVDLRLVEEGVDWLKSEGEGEMMVLVCGPKGLEEGAKWWVEEKGQSWGIHKEDVCFF